MGPHFASRNYNIWHIHKNMYAHREINDTCVCPKLSQKLQLRIAKCSQIIHYYRFLGWILRNKYSPNSLKILWTVCLQLCCSLQLGTTKSGLPLKTRMWVGKLLVHSLFLNLAGKCSSYLQNVDQLILSNWQNFKSSSRLLLKKKNVKLRKKHPTKKFRKTVTSDGAEERNLEAVKRSGGARCAVRGKSRMKFGRKGKFLMCMKLNGC